MRLFFFELLTIVGDIADERLRMKRAGKFRDDNDHEESYKRHNERMIRG